LGIEALPSADAPRIYVQGRLPGANARVVSRSLAAPLERRLGQVAGVEGMYSKSSAGAVMLQLSFTHDTDIDRASRDVQQAITAALPLLPRGMPEPPVYFRYDNSLAPLVTLTATSPALSRDRLYTVLDEQLKPYLARLPGVARAYVFGGSPTAMRVRLDTGALASKGLTPSDVANVLRAQGVPFPLGSLAANGGQMPIELQETPQNVSQLGGIVIAQRDGREVKLVDVATIESGAVDPSSVAYSDGKPAVLLQVTQQAGANAVSVTDQVRAVVEDFKRSMGGTVSVAVSFDTTGATRAALREVGWTLLTSVALVILVTLAFVRRFAQTALIAITIPLTLAGSMLAMLALGYSVNMLTLLSMVLCVGFVVDDAIVMVESITRHIEHGDHPARAAARSFGELRATLVCVTASMLAAFIPVMYGNGQIYVFLRQFSVTLAVAVALSLLVSLFILPSLCASHLRPSRHTLSENHSRRVLLDTLVDGILRYRRPLRWAPLIMLALGFGLYRAVLSSAGAAYMPAEDTGLVLVRLTTAAGATIDARAKAMREAQETVQDDPDVEHVTGYIDAAGAQLFVDLTPRGSHARTDGIADVVTRLSRTLNGLPHASASVSSVGFLGNGAFASSESTQAGSTFQLLSYDGANLAPWVARMSEMLSRKPAFSRVQSDASASPAEVQIHVDRDTASRLGVSMANIDDTLFDAFGEQSMAVGLGPTGDKRPVILSSAPPTTLEDLRVRSSTAAMIPLGSLARLERKGTETGIVHQEQIEAAGIHYEMAPGTTINSAMEEVTRAGFDVGLPQGVRVRFDGEARLIEGLRSNGIELVAAAIIAMYVVLGMLYESVVHPLTILSSLPAAVVGAFSAMWLTNTPMTTVSLIAIILLVGVVKRNAIILVNHALVAMRQRNLDPVNAIREACLTRFRAIAMTSLVAVGTAVPLIIGNGTGDGVQRPLGIAIAGGLVIAQAMAFFTTPAAFLLASDLAPVWGRLTRRLRRSPRSP
jgi:multidrug efflux pump